MGWGYRFPWIVGIMLDEFQGYLGGKLSYGAYVGHRFKVQGHLVLGTFPDILGGWGQRDQVPGTRLGWFCTVPGALGAAGTRAWAAGGTQNPGLVPLDVRVRVITASQLSHPCPASGQSCPSCYRGEAELGGVASEAGGTLSGGQGVGVSISAPWMCQVFA